MNSYKILSAILILAGISACKNSDPKPDNPPVNATELITTVRLHLTDSADGTRYVYEFNDPDGDGGNLPLRFDTIRLKASHSYLCRIELLDESKTPADTVSNEVLEEAENHLFVFSSSSAGLNIHITDSDQNGLPLGLQSIWRCSSTTQGDIRIRLKHQPGIKTGSPDPGESDVDLTFILLIN